MKTIKNAFASLLATLVLALGLANVAAACTDVDPCDNGPYLNWQSANAIEVGGQFNNWGKAWSGADGQGNSSQSQAFTLTEGVGTVSTLTSLVVDAQAGCTDCGDNQYKLGLEGFQKASAGAQNLSQTANGPAMSVSEGKTLSGFTGFAFGRSTVLTPLQ